MTADISPELAARIARIELLLLDVDGVLTDGSIVYTDDRREIKRFHVRDGSGLKFWHQAGKRSAIVSGRKASAVDVRAAELGITLVYQGHGEKLPAFEKVLERANVDADHVCAIGDDLPDLPVLRRCGVGIAVADACAELRAAADYVTTIPGGRGAVREAIEWLLKVQGGWNEVLRRL